MLCAWLTFIPGGSQFGWLIAGVILLDLGTQGQRILNQTDVLSFKPTARSRANTAYISGNFLGAAVGSLTATALWGAGGWRGCARGSREPAGSPCARMTSPHDDTLISCSTRAYSLAFPDGIAVARLGEDSWATHAATPGRCPGPTIAKVLGFSANARPITAQTAAISSAEVRRVCHPALSGRV
jgi:MFS family permease